MTVVYVLIFIVLLLGAIYVAICYIFAQMTLNPSRQPVAVSPADYGLEYEEVEFDSLEGLRLKGWFIPGDPRKVLLLTHPMYCNRHGFLVRNKSPLIGVKTDIELLLSVRALNKAGYSVLTFDFRNHGASEDGMTGVGLNECQDVLGALDYLEGRPDLQAPDLGGPELGLVAFCMGANAAIIAMSRDPEAFARARCLVAIQPISMSVFVRSYLRSTYTRLGLMALPLTEGLRRWLGGHPLEEMSPRKYVKDIKVPTLYVQGRLDPWTELSDIEGFYQATQAPKEFWWLETTKSRPEAYQYVGENPQRLVEFIDAHMA
jgi:pimeloyl-ACP methyl ester carboxylesterase